MDVLVGNITVVEGGHKPAVSQLFSFLRHVHQAIVPIEGFV